LREPPAIEAIGPGGFRVAGVWRPGSLIIVCDAPSGWRPSRLDEVSADDLAAVLRAGAAQAEFVLLGTGETQRPPPRVIGDVLRGAGIGLEFMATRGAARLHNVLASEGRLFATALIAL
jgi:uncharacterized protein